MKNIAFVSLIAAGITLSSCGGDSTKPSEKQAKLDKLIKELNGLETQSLKLKEEIAKLEKELGKDKNNGLGKVVEVETTQAANFSSYIVLEGVADA